MQQDRWCGDSFRSTYPFVSAGFVRGICQRAVAGVPKELREECESEAWLVLWQAHQRLEALPEAQRGAYAAVCVRHRIGQLCRRERLRRSRLVPLEALPARDDRGAAPCRPGEVWDSPFADRLLDQVGRTDLAAALVALPARDRHLLDLFYVQQLTDAEIGRRWNVSGDAVKMKRHRALVKMRHALTGTNRRPARRKPNEGPAAGSHLQTKVTIAGGR